MKNIMIALALVGVSFSSAHAQTKRTASKQTCKCAAIEKNARDTKTVHGHLHHGSSTSGDTYQVCVERNGHYDCCLHHKKVVTAETK